MSARWSLWSLVLVVACLALGCSSCSRDPEGQNPSNNTDEPDAGGDTGEPDAVDCEDGQVACDGSCVDPMTDPEHCGGCEPCVAGDNAAAVACEAGQCVFECEPGFEDANGDLSLRQEGNGCECERQAEVCDGEDNDCDGLTDGEDDDLDLEGSCGAQPGAELSGCEEGRCVYTCQMGREDADGDLGQDGGTGCECVPRMDGLEVCDGRDNDCDGQVDEQGDGFVVPLCELQQGVCQGAQTVCGDGGPVECTAEVYLAHSAQFEAGPDVLELSCDGVDNNCNGEDDENCCEPGHIGRPILDVLSETNSQFLVAAAADEDSERFFVAWQEASAPDDDDVETDGVVRYAAVNVGGLIVQGTVGLLDSNPSTDIQPAVAWDGEAFVLVWVRHDANDELVWRRVSPNGVVLGETEIVAGIGLSIRDAAIESKANGETVVMWSQGGGCDNAEAITCIRAMSVDRDGVPSAQTELSVGAGATNPRSISLSVNNDGSGMVLWHEALLTQPAVQWRQFDAELQSGDEVGGAELVARSLDVGPQMFQVTDGFLVVYSELQGQTMQIHVQRLNLQGQADGLPQIITSGDQDKSYPKVVRFGRGEVRVVFAQENAFAMVGLDETGAPQGEPMTVLEEQNFGFRPLSVLPLPDVGAVMVSASQSTNAPNNRERILFNTISAGADLLCLSP